MWALVFWIFALLLSLASVSFILFCGYVFYIHRKYDHIPGPPRSRVQKYGPVVRLNFLHNVMILVTSPEAVKEFLMSPKYTKDWFYSRLANMFGVRFMGRGLVTDRDYDHWHKQRRIMDPAFSRTYLIGMMAPFNEKAEDLVERLAEKADGKTEIGMHDMLCRVTLDVISKVAFGMDLNSIDDDQTPFPQAISLAMRGLVEMRNPFLRFSMDKQQYIKDTQESLRLLRKTGRECINRRRKAIEDGEDIPVDILTQILKGAAQEDECDMEDLIDNFVTFFIAGQETTANQLSFTVIELARNPDILKKAQDEVDEVIGSKRDLEYDDLGKLQYLSQVLKESLRLYPTAPGTSRALEEETVIEGVRIPANSSLMFNSYIMGRMEQFYPDPLVFNPDRFHPDAPKPYFTYFPFSLGPRSCIGQVFAQMEAKVVMAKLLQRFEFELVEGQSFKINDTGSLRPMGGAVCRLRPRTISGTMKK
ncbi:cholesterol 24-hydroxylase-like isoform X2 [Rana temporaria]|uniref:cholesterol 24-hydroxylase-like isoform X2 n=1 Tax=Rana temporaria TaxID=8407 RepID=UPI001AAC8870|nr:cholesterol 24-hydroxylase-like isoform X2 [Rana temporaria]